MRDTLDEFMISIGRFMRLKEENDLFVNSSPFKVKETYWSFKNSLLSSAGKLFSGVFVETWSVLEVCVKYFSSVSMMLNNQFGWKPCKIYCDIALKMIKRATLDTDDCDSDDVTSPFELFR
jgi:hypothetical protein